VTDNGWILFAAMCNDMCSMNLSDCMRYNGFGVRQARQRNTTWLSLPAALNLAECCDAPA